MSTHSRYVTVVNRSSRDLQGTYNGIHYILEPGNHSFPLNMALLFKNQNPIKGSDDPETGNLEYLIGILEEGDPVSPIEQSDEIELYNRKNRANAVPVVVVPGNVGLYSLNRDKVAGVPLPSDSSFTKP